MNLQSTNISRINAPPDRKFVVVFDHCYEAGETVRSTCYDLSQQQGATVCRLSLHPLKRGESGKFSTRTNFEIEFLPKRANVSLFLLPSFSPNLKLGELGRRNGILRRNSCVIYRVVDRRLFLNKGN